MAGQACRYGAFQRPLRRSVVKGQYQRPSGLQLDPPPHVVPAVLDGALHRRLASARARRSPSPGRLGANAWLSLFLRSRIAQSCGPLLVMLHVAIRSASPCRESLIAFTALEVDVLLHLLREGRHSRNFQERMRSKRRPRICTSPSVRISRRG
jgi:hypothetical protein